MRRLIILGSTGSVGTNTLDIVSRFPDRFAVVGLTGGRNSDKLEKQIRQFRPVAVSVREEETARDLRERCRGLDVEILWGIEGQVRVATLPQGDTVVSAIVGAAGLIPTLSAIRAKKTIALANKETLVMAGEIVQQERRKNGVTIIPVDSEHSAIFQANHGHRWDDVRRLILTASGGPFWGVSSEEKKRVSPKEALKHPTWNMGEKISIDSATLMNKGFEVIEARWLFDIPPERISIMIHRQSIVHSMVEYIDGSVIAQLGVADMRGPISYALNYPERLPLSLPPLDLVQIGSLTFEAPDVEEFPCLAYAYEALKSGGTMPAVLNAANEEVVSAYLQERVGFLDIPCVIRATMDAHTPCQITSVEDVLAADGWARTQARSVMEHLH